MFTNDVYQSNNKTCLIKWLIIMSGRMIKFEEDDRCITVSNDDKEENESSKNLYQLT